MNNCKGFVLFDAMLGLSLFMFTVLYVVPELIEVYKERTSVSERAFAVEQCHNLLQEWIVLGKEPDQPTLTGENGNVYSIHWTHEEEIMEICIDWNGANGRVDSVCGKAK
ncbi:hypothetical protein [Pseudalkalibacillus sp. SCS-8]|uniref:hypothetical protein n=1 Tax=Pseudalkalibacillus nanhaiensis TaxID=3115291 RepID=UPI0032DA6C30